MNKPFFTNYLQDYARIHGEVNPHGTWEIGFGIYYSQIPARELEGASISDDKPEAESNKTKGTSPNDYWTRRNCIRGIHI